jgi:hypothetical protein
VENSRPGRYCGRRQKTHGRFIPVHRIPDRGKSSRTGRTPDQIVRDALTLAGNVLPWRNPAKPLPEAMSKATRIAEMEEIAARSAARPAADPRSIDEIIGYDDFGVPR